MCWTAVAMNRSGRVKFIVIAVAFFLFPYNSFVLGKEEPLQTTTKPFKQFRSKHSDVYIIPDFLPRELAIKWRSVMKEGWTNTTSFLRNRYSGSSYHGLDDTFCVSSASNNGCEKNDDASTLVDNTFLYATNNNGKRWTQNAKSRSLQNMEQRYLVAQKIREYGQFAYAKFELPPSHWLVKEMEDTFTSNEIRHMVTNILRIDHPKAKLVPQLSDLFVTFFGTGDFLSSHNDGICGTWAIVLSLMEGPPGEEWEPHYGGGLRFQCDASAVANNNSSSTPSIKDDDFWCEYLYPTFNTAIIFQTRVYDGQTTQGGPFHEVLPVSLEAEAAGFYRFGVTGWYMDVSDEMPENIKQERDKMRARD